MENRHLYKAKRIDNGKWVTGFYVKGSDMYGEEVHVIFETDAIFFSHGETDGFAEINPSTICQCTGLEDKNGKLIWENDIVEAWSQGSKATGKVRQRIDGLWFMYPAWQKQEFWGLCPNNDRETTVEVIGNIFDNPELLDGKVNDDRF